MTSSDDHLPPALESAMPSARKRSWLKRFMAAFAVLLVLLAAGAYLVWQSGSRETERALTSEPVAHVPVRDEETQTRLQALEEHLRRVDERLDKLEQAAPAPVATAEVPAGDSSALQKQITELMTSLADLRETVKQVEQKTEQNRREAQDALSRLLAFSQLRTVALSGEAFTQEEQAMRQAAGQDSALLDSLARIEPLAPHGVGDFTSLRDDYEALRHPAETALRKAEAQGWWDRVIVALKGIVSVRPLHPTDAGDDVFATIASDLEHHRLNLVLERLAELPEPAQAVLKDWRDRVEARQRLEVTLNEMTSRLMRPQ